MWQLFFNNFYKIKCKPKHCSEICVWYHNIHIALVNRAIINCFIIVIIINSTILSPSFTSKMCLLGIYFQEISLMSSVVEGKTFWTSGWKLVGGHIVWKIVSTENKLLNDACKNAIDGCNLILFSHCVDKFFWHMTLGWFEENHVTKNNYLWSVSTVS